MANDIKFTSYEEFSAEYKKVTTEMNERAKKQSTKTEYVSVRPVLRFFAVDSCGESYQTSVPSGMNILVSDILQRKLIVKVLVTKNVKPTGKYTFLSEIKSIEKGI